MMQWIRKVLSILLVLTLILSNTLLAIAEQSPEQPTDAPTVEPTAEPTAEPTPEPTEAPTPEPTEAPTPKPTEAPTIEPTEEPTVEPTEEPTAEPPEEPTAEPTEEPTTEPTEEPTDEPTGTPTADPTGEPTLEPTQEPAIDIPPNENSNDEGNVLDINTSDDVIASGTEYPYTDHPLTWVLRTNGTLTITGSGELYISDPDSIWAPYAEYVEKLEIGDGITTFSTRSSHHSMFDLFVNLKEAYLSSTVTTIGDHAFDDCASLQGITIPNSVTTIGDHAFDGCASLQSITIPNSVTSIGEHAFAGCSSLSTVRIPDSISIINDFTFDGSGLSNVIIPNTIKSIGRYAFASCDNLVNITIPDSVTLIDVAAFRGCNNLKTVSFGTGLRIIWNDAFWMCYSITDVYYSGSVEQWKKIRILDGNADLQVKTIHFNSTGPDQPSVQTSGLKLGVLQGVDMAKDTVTVDGKEYLVYSNFMEPMDSLLKNKKITDKRVVLELLEGVVVSCYSIYDVMSVGMSFTVATEPAELIYQDGKYNAEQFNMDVTLTLNTNDLLHHFEYYTDRYDLQKAGASLTVDRMELEIGPDPKYFYFGKTLLVKNRKITVNFDPVTLTFDPSEQQKVVTITGIDIDADVVPEEEETKSSIFATLGYAGMDIDALGSDAPWQNLEVSITNRDKGEEAKVKAEQEALEAQLVASLASNEGVSFAMADEGLIQYMRECGYTDAQIKSVLNIIEQSLVIYLSDVVSASQANIFPETWIKRMPFLDKATQDDLIKEANKLQGKILNKLGLKENVLPSQQTITLEPEFTIGKKIHVLFTIDMQVFFNGKTAYASYATIRYTIEGTNKSGVGIFTKADMEAFANIMLDYLKIAYNESWGTKADKIASAIIEEPYYKLLFGKATFSGKMFEIPLEESKKNVKKTTTKCPVDVYVYDSKGALCAQIVNNSAVCNDDSLICLAEGDTKIVYYTGGDYSIKLVGTGTGTMEQIVEEFEEGNLVRTVTTKDIPLSVGKTYTGSIPAALYVDNDAYALKSDSGETIEIDTDTLEPQEQTPPHYTVAIEDTGMGYSAQLTLDKGSALAEGTGYLYYVWMFKGANDSAFNSYGIAPIEGDGETASVYIGKMGGSNVRVTGLMAYVVTDTELYGELLVKNGEHFGYAYKGM